MYRHTIYNIILLLTLAITATAAPTPQTIDADAVKKQADSAYTARRYSQARDKYLQLVRHGKSLSVYYNLACSYYRLEDYPNSVLWFERASRLDPSDDDVRHNLDMARSKTIDRIVPRHRIFFVSAWNSLTHFTTITRWAQAAISLFAIALLMAALYLFGPDIRLRKAGFFTSISATLLCILCNLCAYSQRYDNNHHSAGILMSPSVTVKSTPEKTGKSLFVLHHGTRVEIQDDSMKDWVEITIADGKTGWIPRNTYQEI
ncbi:MAG: tetratricopeptide repeat protein [Bacteroidaceae bacterium]|nr:tetratricopeptide repeat protein [Bacteroidaceae bacterium]